MAQPMDSVSRELVFSQDQQVSYKVDYYDVTNTVPSVGIGFTYFDIVDSVGFTEALETVSRGNIEGALLNKDLTQCVLSYDGSAYRMGVSPLIYQYWGAGTLPGGRISKQLAIKYSGYSKVTGDVTLVFAGQGSVYVSVEGGTVAGGTIREPLPDPDITSLAQFTSEAGYVVVPISVTVGDLVEIYYWHNLENWGGIACKVLPYELDVSSYDPDRIRAEVRDAPALSASFLGVEADGSDAPATEIPYLGNVNVRKDKQAVPEISFEVAMAHEGDELGFHYDKPSNSFVDNASALTLKPGRLVKFYGGYADWGESGVVDEHIRFTGLIVDFKFNEELSIVTFTCQGAGETRLTGEQDQNYPDLLSYHANGYIHRDRLSEPVWGIMAFDNWHVEAAIAELCYRAGVDSYCLGKSPVSASPSHAYRSQYTLMGDELIETDRLFALRHLADTDRKVQLEKQSNYGNVGIMKRDYIPNDDPYLFVPELLERLYDKAETIANHLGYDFYFNSDGQAVIFARNNPAVFLYATSAYDSVPLDLSVTDITLPGDRGINPSAVGGQFLRKEYTDDAWSIQLEGYFARLDLYTGVGEETATGLNGCNIDYTVEVWDAAWVEVDSGSISTYREGKNVFFYNEILNGEGKNVAVSTLFSLPFDQYRVTLTSGSLDPDDVGATNALVRINGIAVFYRDPEGNAFGEQAFSTLANAFSVVPDSRMEDQRNHVVVVGARKATVTDSDKFEDNPNNPGFEFHVSVAVDPFSIYDPEADNFVGARRMTVVYDEKISDSAFARWLSKTILYRYRKPNFSVPVDHTAVPTLEIRDPILVYEAGQESVNNLCWVQSFEETWTPTSARVKISADTLPEIPSFQPREDIPIDDLFDHDEDGKGEPVINVEISYKNLYGVTVDNADLTTDGLLGAFQPLQAVRTAEPISSGVSHTTASPACPDTIAIIGKADSETTKFDRILTNHPYRRFYTLDFTAGVPTLTWDFQEGDGSDVYTPAYYEFPTGGDYDYSVLYRALQTRSGANPFYDPYTSEVGNVVNVKFDALISGRYRVSIWDGRRSGGRSVPIAWLTNPTGEATEPDAHWVYLDPQAEVEFVWDGVDNIGFWNRFQSTDSYAAEIEGSFEDEPLAVGSGFYAWNDQATSIFTQIGDNVSDNWESGGKFDDYPYFTIGKYGQFYVRIEVRNDILMERDGSRIPRTVNSNALAEPYNTVEDVYIWTHLGEPSQVYVSIEDWGGSAWEEGTEDDLWGALDADASIKDGKPIRVSFTPRGRPGVLFGRDPEKTSVKINRLVHLKTTVLDQFWTFFGRPWLQVKSGNYAEEKRITSRMFHNDEHTLSFNDDAFREGQDIQAFTWVFQPSHFEKDFGLGIEEQLRFGDYMQLEALPGHNPRQSGGATKTLSAYMTLAFMSYLFYFSAYTIDRSGRRQWCLNNSFIDKTKIVSSGMLAASDATYSVDYDHLGADKYLKRTVFVREWIEDEWASVPSTMGLSPAHEDHIADISGDAFAQEWLQIPIRYLDPNLSVLQSLSSTKEDKWMVAYRTVGHQANKDINAESDSPNRNTIPTAWPLNVALPTLGNWDFRRGSQSVDWYIPSPKRDFHPYWRVPIMPDWGTLSTQNYSPGVHLFAGTGSQIIKPLRDVAAEDTWFGWAFQHAAAESNTGLRGARLEETVQSFASNVVQTHFNIAFDYERQDTTDRFDQFRGLWSRGPFENRDLDEDVNWWDDEKRVGVFQATKPSGVYLLNAMRYDEYIISPMHKTIQDFPVHYVNEVTEWYDFRFRHEYVWYNDRHFPVDGQGFNLYGFHKNEYTNVQGNDAIVSSDKVQKLGYQEHPSRVKLRFDAGAWTGWKDDIADSAWTSDPHLRWRENAVAVGVSVLRATVIGNTYGPDEDKAMSCGFSDEEFFDKDGDVGLGGWQGENRYYKHTNIFDSGTGRYGWFRLAVGPEAPESRGIHISLVLPEELI